MAKRKDVEKFIINWIYKITNSKYNVELYEDFFKGLNNKEFEDFLTKLGKNEMILNIIVPHDGDAKINLRKNIDVLAKELGYSFHQHLYIKPDDDSPVYKSKYPYLILTMPIRRVKQTIEKGISVADNDTRVDSLTGQPTGDSRTSKLSYPELQLLVGMGIQDAAIELLKYRGGDPGAYYAIRNSLLKYGKVSKKLVDAYADGVISTATLKALFNGMHYKINL